MTFSEPRPTGVGLRPVGQVPDVPSGDVFESVDVSCRAASPTPSVNINHEC